MKKLISVFLSVILVVFLSVSAFADFVNVPTQTEITSSVKDPGGPGRPEETMWIYRTTESGLLQKRLWSLTYGYWLTDWITIGYV
jgi:hypothetical protein